MGDSIQWATEPGQILSDYEIMVATKMTRRQKNGGKTRVRRLVNFFSGSVVKRIKIGSVFGNQG